MTTVSEQARTQHAALDARGSSGSTVTDAFPAVSLVPHHGSVRMVSVPTADRDRVFTAETMGTGTEVVSLRITERDLITQLSRVYQALSTGQVDLDAEASRILHRNLWSLY